MSSVTSDVCNDARFGLMFDLSRVVVLSAVQSLQCLPLWSNLPGWLSPVQCLVTW
jgi:hypothetical protein